MSFWKKLVSSLIFLVITVYSIFAQNYEDLFPEQYQKALVLKDVYTDLLIEMGIDSPDFYIAIVFPEMERYTVTRDELETVFTKITYTTISDYEGCSIGPFQMKPGFAFDVEDEIRKLPELIKKYPELYFETDDSDFTSRYERIIRLRSKKYQIMYLMAFVDICNLKYHFNSDSTDYRLKLISAAYNAGLKDTPADFDLYFSKKSFPDGYNSSMSLWNYSDLVIHYYKIFSSERNN